MLLLRLITLLLAFAVAALIPVKSFGDGFDFPVGYPNGVGYNHTAGWDFLDWNGSAYHPGEDWNGNGGGDSDLGDPVHAAANGTVIASGDYGSGWGNIILVRHDLPGETVWTQYAHLQTRLVSSGSVTRGQQIGTIGKGYNNEYWAHLHFEVRKQDMATDAWTTGWTSAQVQQAYYDPSDFIAAHRPSGVSIVVSDPISTNATRTGPAVVYALPDEYGAGEPEDSEKNFLVSVGLQNAGATTVTLTNFGVQILKGGAHQFYLSHGASVVLGPGASTPSFNKHGWITDARLDGGSATVFEARAVYDLGSGWTTVTGGGANASFTVQPRPPLGNGMLVKKPKPAGSSDPDLTRVYFHQWGHKWAIEDEVTANNIFPQWPSIFYVYPSSEVTTLGLPASPLSDATTPSLAGRNLLFMQPGDNIVYIVEPEPLTSGPLVSRPFANEDAFWTYGYSQIGLGDLVTQPIELSDGFEWVINNYPVGSEIGSISVDPPESVTAWWDDGTDPGHFQNPWGVAVNSVGEVFVVDLINDRVQKYSASGELLLVWGSSGTGNGQFLEPHRVAIDSEDNVYVTDNGNDCVQKFSSEGVFLTRWGTEGCCGPGAPPSTFNQPIGIAVDESDVIYVLDRGNYRVQRFTSSGAFIDTWEAWHSSETGKGRSLMGIEVEPNGNTYVCSGYPFPENAFFHKVQKFTSTGTFIAEWGEEGAAPGQFVRPFDLAITNHGTVLVADTDNYRIQEFSRNGTFLQVVDAYGGVFPVGITVNGTGDILVTDNNALKIFRYPPVLTINRHVPVGSEVSIPLSNVTLTFDEVVSAGEVSMLLESTGPPLPGGIVPIAASAPMFYDCETDAELLGDVRVDIPYDPASIQGFEWDLLLLSYSVEHSAWRNITSSIYAASNRIEGSTSALSRFVIAEPGMPTGLEEPTVPAATALVANTPNPFRTRTSVRYELSAASFTRLDVFDVNGMKVRTLVHGFENAGRYEVTWDGRGESGGSLPAGVYFMKFDAGQVVEARKILLIR